MLPISLGKGHEGLSVLCIGAHSDDIEIGCTGTLLRWVREYPQLHVTWVVLSARGARAAEARRSARALMRGAKTLDVVVGDFEDAHFPVEFRELKAFLAEVRRRCDPQVVLTHGLDDRHQDHRLVAEMTWQHWRDHLVLEYEIPKYEGDLGHPNLYAPLPAALVERKIGHLDRHFGTQRSKDWFSDSTFRSLMRLRGVECRAASGYAEAFTCRKSIL